MADGAVSPPPDAQDGPAPVERAESDFSPRKMKNAAVILLGQTFASSILPFVALSYVLPSMTKDFGWSRTEFLLANSALMFFGAMTTWPMGILTDKIGARPIILLGTLGVGVATLLVPLIHNDPIGVLPRAWEFYALFAVIGMFGSSGASYAKVITALFTQNRGKAMAVLGAEGTVARMVIPGMTAFLILHYGWQGLFTTMGAVVLAIVPLVFFFLEEPGTRGLKPSLSFRKPATPAGGQGLVMAFEGMSFLEVWRDKVFWLMLVAGLLPMVTGNGMLANVPVSLTDRGFSLQTVGTIDSIATFAGVPGVLLAGYLMDKIHSPKVAAPFHLLTAVSAILTMVVTPAVGGQPLLLVARCLFNFAFTASLPLSGYLMTRFFGLKAFAQIYGFMSAIQAICMSAAPPAFGHIYDATHSYRLGYEIWAATALVAAAVYLILPRYRFSADIGAMPAPQKGRDGNGRMSAAGAAAE